MAQAWPKALYREQAGMRQFGERLWLADGPCVHVAGFHYPTRMAVVALRDGLLIWSPIALSDEVRASVTALGEVREIVAPNSLHHLALADWAAAFPSARLHATPRLRQKRRDLVFHADLGAAPDPAWAEEMDQVIFPTLITGEAVFFHRASGAALFCDLLQQFPPGWFKGWRRMVAGLDGMTGAEPQVPRKFWLATVNRRAARGAVGRIMSWPVQRVAMAHGAPVVTAGAAFLRQAFRWV